CADADQPSREQSLRPRAGRAPQRVRFAAQPGGGSRCRRLPARAARPRGGTRLMTRQPGKPTSTPNEATAAPSREASPTTPEAAAAISKPRASRRRLYAPDPATTSSDAMPKAEPRSTTNAPIAPVAAVAPVAAAAPVETVARTAPRPVTRSPMLRRLRAKQTIRD